MKEKTPEMVEKLKRHNSNLTGTVGTSGLTGFWRGKYFKEGQPQISAKRFPGRGSITFNSPFGFPITGTGYTE